jgi:large subunit ribosomal protein L32
MAVPKRKLSKARKNKRRSNVWKLDMPAMAVCNRCGEIKAPHKVCGSCGYYKEKLVLSVLDSSDED